MSLAEGFLTRCVTRVKEAIDDPDIEGKYSNTQIVNFLEEAYAEIIGEIMRNSKASQLCYFDIVLGAPTADQRYVLPPIIGSVRSIEILDSGGAFLGYLMPEGLTTSGGQGSRISGNILFIAQNRMASGGIVRIRYVPKGTSRLHDGTASAATASTVTLAATPNQGELDRRENAYAGSTIRLLGDVSNIMQERLIYAYDPTTRVASIKPDFSPVPTSSVGPPVVSILYEIGPLMAPVLQPVIAYYAAQSIAAVEGMREKVAALNLIILRRMRTLRLNAAHYNAYDGLFMNTDTAFIENG